MNPAPTLNAVGGVATPMTADTAETLSAAVLRDRLAAGDPVTLLDVRDRAEVERWRIETPSLTHVHVPYVKFVAAGVTGDVTDLLPADRREPVVVVCARGAASAEVAEELAAAGVDARNLADGMAGVVDPLRAFVDRYRADAADLGVDLTHAVDTHVHADHVSGVRALAAATGATPVLPRNAVDRGVADADAFETIRDGDRLPIGEAELAAVGLPGHTTGMTGFAVGAAGDADALLTGDSLFLDGVARPDLQEAADPETQARELYATLTERLARFPDAVLVAPGHTDAGVASGPAVARLGDLRTRLDAFGTDETGFVERTTQGGAEPANAERIVGINRGTETVDDGTAFELELGPNNCAAGG